MEFRLIKLEGDEVCTLFTALTVAKNFYQERGMTEEAQKHEALFELLFHSAAIQVEFGPGLTESGMAGLQEILQKRRLGLERDSKVVEFPGGKQL